MPCDSIRTNSLRLETALKNEALLEKGLFVEFGKSVRKLGTGRYAFSVDGMTVTMDGVNFRSTLSESRLGEVVGRVQQAYSREAVKAASKRFGWVAQFDKNDVNAFTLTHN
jgi:hypothetical protein